MYQDKHQWIRLAYVAFNLLVVWYLVQPEQVQQLMAWSHDLDGAQVLPLLQLTLLVVSSGLIFPKAKTLEPIGQDGKATSDFKQLVVGMFLSAAGWFMSVMVGQPTA